MQGELTVSTQCQVCGFAVESLPVDAPQGRYWHCDPRPPSVPAYLQGPLAIMLKQEREEINRARCANGLDPLD